MVKIDYETFQGLNEILVAPGWSVSQLCQAVERCIDANRYCFFPCNRAQVDDQCSSDQRVRTFAISLCLARGSDTLSSMQSHQASLYSRELTSLGAGTISEASLSSPIHCW